MNHAQSPAWCFWRDQCAFVGVECVHFPCDDFAGDENSNDGLAEDALRRLEYIDEWFEYMEYCCAFDN